MSQPDRCRDTDIAVLQARLQHDYPEDAADQYDQEPTNISAALALLPAGPGPLPAAPERVTEIALKIQASESNRLYWSPATRRADPGSAGQ